MDEDKKLKGSLVLGLHRVVDLLAKGTVDSRNAVLLIHDLMLVFDPDFETFRQFGSSAHEQK